jgi:hypothetical protein
MADDADGMNRMARQHVLEEVDHDGDLRPGIIGQTKVMAAIDDLDADGARIQIAGAAPTRYAGMPSPPAFIDHAKDTPIFLDDVMRRDFRVRIAQPVDRARPV